MGTRMCSSWEFPVPVTGDAGGDHFVHPAQTLGIQGQPQPVLVGFGGGEHLWNHLPALQGSLAERGSLLRTGI